MNGLGALRKGYAELTPTERASMFLSEIAGRQREEAVLALRPTTAIEAAQESKAMIAMLIVAGSALTAALMAERDGLALLAKRQSSLDKGIAEVSSALAASTSMALALQQLEKETGHAFYAAADLLDGGSFLANKIKGRDREIELDTSVALEKLRELWEVGKRMIAT